MYFVEIGAYVQLRQNKDKKLKFVGDLYMSLPKGVYGNVRTPLWKIIFVYGVAYVGVGVGVLVDRFLFVLLEKSGFEKIVEKIIRLACERRPNPIQSIQSNPVRRCTMNQCII